MAVQRRRYVSVIGGYEVDDAVLAQAEEVGRLLAARDVVVVTGGRSGVSEAASKGAYEAGGTTVGILPGRDRREANPYLTVAVSTGLGETRNALVAMNGEAVIAFDGAFGTLTEIAFALLERRPLVAVGRWRATIELPDDPIVRVDTPADAVDAALALVAGEVS